MFPVMNDFIQLLISLEFQKHAVILGIALMWCTAIQPMVLIKLFYMMKKNIPLSLINGNLLFGEFSYLNRSLVISAFYLICFLFMSSPANLLISIPLCLVLIQLSFFDLRYFWLPDRLSVPLIITGLCLSIGSSDQFYSSLLGGLAGFLMFQVPRIIFNHFMSRETLGFGDVKLAVAMGIWLGVELLPLTISLASLLALIYYMTFMYFAKSADRKIALGVFLCAAFWLAWVFIANNNYPYFVPAILQS